MVIVSVLVFLWSYPVLAQYGYGRDEGKFVVKVEGWWVTPTGMGFDVATVDPNYDISTFTGAGGEMIGIEFDSKFSGKYTLGWNFKEDVGSLTLSYWKYDEESSMARYGELRSFIIGEILPHSYYSGQGFYPVVDINPPDGINDNWDTGRADAVEGIASLQVKIFDLDFSRKFSQQQRFSSMWRIGLRNFKYEHLLQATYLGDPFDKGGDFEILDITSEVMKADGTGPKVGFFGRYSFTPNVTLYGGLDVSFIPGKIDTRYLSINDLEEDVWDPITNPDGQETFPFGPFTFTLNREDKDENFIIYDFDAGFEIAIAQKLNLTFGYRLTKMENVIYRVRFNNDADLFQFYENPEIAESHHNDISFGGLYFGIAYEF